MFAANLGSSVQVGQNFNYLRSNGWQRATSFPARIEYSSCEIADNGNIYHFGGRFLDANNNITDTAAGYTGIIDPNNPEIINWQQNNNLPARVVLQASAKLNDGRIIAVGGFFPDTTNRRPPWVYIGTPTTTSITWVQSSDYPGMPGAYGYDWGGVDTSVCTVLKDGRVVLMGGYWSNACCWNGSSFLYRSGAVDRVLIGTISGNSISWIQTNSLPQVRWSGGACTLGDGRIVYCGGLNWAAEQRGSYPSIGSEFPYLQTNMFIGNVNGNSITWTNAGSFPQFGISVDASNSWQLSMGRGCINKTIPVPGTLNKFLLLNNGSKFQRYDANNVIGDVARFYLSDLLVEVANDNTFTVTPVRYGTLFRNTVVSEGQTILPFSRYPYIGHSSGMGIVKYNPVNRRLYCINTAFDFSSPDELLFDSSWTGPDGRPGIWPDGSRVPTGAPNLRSSRSVIFSNRL